MRGRSSFWSGYRSLYAGLASSASDGDALTLDLRDPALRALLRQLRLVVLVEGAADELVATDRPQESRSIQMPYPVQNVRNVYTTSQILPFDRL